MDNSNKKLVFRCVRCNHHPMEPVCKPTISENAKTILFVCSVCGRYMTMSIEEEKDE